METVKMHCLCQIETPNGINHHRAWYCDVNGIEIHSNEDVLGDKFYIVNSIDGFAGEYDGLKWYSTPTVAAIAFFLHGQEAVDNLSQ